TKTAAVHNDGTEATLELRETTTGILLGPCAAPVPGRTEGKVWIRLKGPGPIYSAGDLEFVDEQGKPGQQPRDLTGSITVDSARHKVIVRLAGEGQALPLNGSYRVKATG